MNINDIQNHLYIDSNEMAIRYINSINDEETLFTYANNYNWDNGFDIPTAIANNASCSLSVALLLFYLADGISYLESKSSNSNLPEWSVFVAMLYERIISNHYSKGNVAFHLELTKVELFKLNKMLTDSEKIFITELDGTDCYITI